MQDKLIEAVAKAIHNAILEGAGSASDWDTTMPPEIKSIYRAAALAAVRAHDAGTVSTAQNAVDAGEFFVTENRLKEVLASSHAAESAPQLDAEDQHRAAEPVEDVVSRMCKLMGGCACEHCIKRMTAALAVANQVRDDQWEATVKTQYYSADVIGFPAYIQAIKARLAPKPSLERFTGFDITYREADMHAFKPRVCGLCGSWVIDDLAHTGWHNNLQLGKQIAALVERRTK